MRSPRDAKIAHGLREGGVPYLDLKPAVRFGGGGSHPPRFSPGYKPPMTAVTLPFPWPERC
jgi:hypothetical protein